MNIGVEMLELSATPAVAVDEGLRVLAFNARAGREFPLLVTGERLDLLCHSNLWEVARRSVEEGKYFSITPADLRGGFEARFLPIDRDSALSAAAIVLLTRNADRDAAISAALTGFKAPLLTLRNSLELLGSTGELKESAATIELLRRSVARALSSASQLCALVSPPSLDSCCDASETVERILLLMSDTLRSAGLQLISEFEPDLMVRGDEAALERAFMNLLSNALTFAKSKIFVSVRGQDDTVIITVHDDGKGLTEDTRHLVFAPWYSCSPDGEASSGLGLPAVERLAASMGGRVASCAGEGGVFRLELPRHEGLLMSSSFPAFANRPSTDYRLLVEAADAVERRPRG